jgi:hypothetical protein
MRFSTRHIDKRIARCVLPAGQDPRRASRMCAWRAGCVSFRVRSSAARRANRRGPPRYRPAAGTYWGVPLRRSRRPDGTFAVPIGPNPCRSSGKKRAPQAGMRRRSLWRAGCVSFRVRRGAARHADRRGAPRHRPAAGTYWGATASPRPYKYPNRSVLNSIPVAQARKKTSVRPPATETPKVREELPDEESLTYFCTTP